MSENAKQRQESPGAAAFRRALEDAEDEPLENLKAASAIFDALASVPRSRDLPEGWLHHGNFLAPVLRRDLTAQTWALYLREAWFDLSQKDMGVEVRVTKALQAPIICVEVIEKSIEPGFAGSYLIDVEALVAHFIADLLYGEERKADGG